MFFQYLLFAMLVLLWLAWACQALLTAWQMRLFAGRFTHTQHDGVSRHKPKAAIIVPFKGLDLDLPKAIASLCTLNYPSYELLLIVDSTADPVYPLLKEEVARYPHIPATILVSGTAGLYEGQKIHNQIFAIDHLLKRQGQADAPEAWVFADSDAIPGPDWLVNLIRPLFGKRVGMTTGYRWLEPVSRPGTSMFWSSIASVINSSVVSFQGKPSYIHAWGGSMALLTKTAIEGDLRGHLEGALCDDYQFGRMVKKMGLRIYFVRFCLVATPVAFNWSSLLNFAHRQYLLTRVYAPTLFYKVFAVIALYVVATITAWAALITLLIRKPEAWYLWSVPAVFIVWVAAWNQVRASMRARTVAAALGPQVVHRLRYPLMLDRWCTWLWMSVHLVFILRGSVGRTMCWRGIYYRLRGPQDVERMNRS